MAQHSRTASDLIGRLGAHLLERHARSLNGGTLGRSRDDAGISVAHHCLDQVHPNRGHGAASLELLEASAEAAADGELGWGIHGGLAGVAWAHELVGCPFGVEFAAEVDDLLCDLLSDPNGRWEADLLRGVVGLGEYGLLRSRTHGSGSAIVRNVIRVLAEQAIANGSGCTWPMMQSSSLSPSQALSPGTSMIGMAHGQAGVVALLSEIVATDPTNGIARELLVQGAQGLRETAGALPGYRFPKTQCGSSAVEAAPRIGWCHGDLGVVYSLWLAGSALKNRSLMSLSREVTQELSLLSPPEWKLVDGGLCHGWFGAALLLERLGVGLDVPEARRCAQYWLEFGIAQAREGGPPYLAVRFPRAGRTEVEDDGVLMGSSGICLALLESLGVPSVPWSRMMLMYKVR